MRRAFKKRLLKPEPCPRCGKIESVTNFRGYGIPKGELWCAKPFGCGKRWIPGMGEYPYRTTEEEWGTFGNEKERATG